MLNYDQALELARLSRDQVRLDHALLQLSEAGFTSGGTGINNTMADNNRRLSELFMLAREEVTTTQSQTPDAYVVLVGNALDGSELVGPFKTAKDATDFGEQQSNTDWLVSYLSNPEGIE